MAIRPEIVEAMREIEESGRQQERLTRALGQVTCSNSPAAHDVENLPCRWCGAAL